MTIIYLCVHFLSITFSFFPGEPLVVQMDTEKQDNVEMALLGGEGSPKRYATSELTQFWVVLKRTLLFSRRDWVSVFRITLY